MPSSIATPDHSHSKILVDAIAAGKDVYCEKPASNTIARVNAMLDAYKKSKQVVQIGTHQRSWDHFIEAKKILDAGTLGNVTQVLIVQPGTYARPKEAEQPVPAGLDWDLWQLDAPKTAVQANAGSASAPGTPTAAAWSATGARTTSTSPTGS